jgi:hypothetical protein
VTAEGDSALLDNLRLSIYVLTAEKSLAALLDGLVERYGGDAVVVRAAENAALALAAVKEMVKVRVREEHPAGS